MRKGEKKGPNFLGRNGPIFNLHIRNPHIKSDNLAKTESLLIFFLGKIGFKPHLKNDFLSGIAGQNV